MTRGDEQRIADILDAAGELAMIRDRGKQAFDDDVLLRRAAERLLEIIGEAAHALTAATTDRHPEVPWRDIGRLRIVLAHHYHRVDADQVWTIVEQHLPVLVDALRAR